MLKKRDWILIGIVLCAAVLVTLFAFYGESSPKDMDIGMLIAPSSPSVTKAAEAPDAIEALAPAGQEENVLPAPGSEAARIIADAAGEEWVADGYVLLTVRGMPYDIIPLRDQGEFVLTQNDIEAANTLHTTKDSVWMAHSTCDNQDCVDQGIMTLNNIKERILGNMIICLPNELMLELITAEELAEGLK